MIENTYLGIDIRYEENLYSSFDLLCKIEVEQLVLGASSPY
jgi:hypothetical protein